MNISIKLTERCNLNCSYCTQKETKNQNKEMGIKDISPLIDFVALFSDKNQLAGEEIEISFYGGEPLLCFPVLKKLHQNLKELGINNFSIHTNIILAKDDIIKYLNENNIHIYLELDGQKESHDFYRKYSDGEGTFNDVLEIITKIKNNYGLSNTSFKLTYTPDTVHALYEGFNFLQELNPSNIHMNPALEYDWNEEKLNILENEYERIVSLVEKKYQENTVIACSNIDQSIKHLLYGAPESCNAGMDTISILPDGTILPCEGFSSIKDRDKFAIGNIETYMNDKKLPHNIEPFRFDEDDCKECKLQGKCQNMCFAINYKLTGGLYSIPDITCYVEQIFLKRAASMLTKLHKEKNKSFANRFYI